MNNSSVKSSSMPFGRRKVPHTVTISNGKNTRRFSIHPMQFAIVSSIVGLFLFGYLGATGYLIIRDDLIGATLARQSRIQHQYEDRIAALRSRLDLITSQQLIEQQAMETRVNELVKRQLKLGSRSGMLSSAIRNAANVGLVPAKATVPKSKPINRRALQDETITTGSVQREEKLRLGSLAGTNSPFAGSIIDLKDSKPDKSGSTVSIAYARDPDGVFASVETALNDVEEQQLSTLIKLRSEAVVKTNKITGILKKLGVKVALNKPANLGGPFVEYDGSKQFKQYITALDRSLADLKLARSKVARFPLGSPVPGKSISSGYGRRIDPIRHRPAMHNGIDFKSGYGKPVLATGGGKVVKAGYSGGYGRMVEIHHGNGLATRYAHLSRISVKVGQTVGAGKIVGKIGSTGRSTGPHLHYEVRYNGKAQNPTRYVRAGAKLKSLL